MKARMLAAGARDDHAGAVHLSIIAVRLEGEGHLSPGRKGRPTAELDSILVNDDRIR